ncbi:MAG: integrase core domain-containing protein [Spirochaetes bacterium]|nr:integrase core domain-containing protein [Spirochaetota bacterium]
MIYYIKNKWDDTGYIGKEFSKDYQTEELNSFRAVTKPAFAIIRMLFMVICILKKAKSIKDLNYQKFASLDIKLKIIKMIHRFQNVLTLKHLLKLVGITKTRYYEWLNQIQFQCLDSPIKRCFKSVSNQILNREVRIIKKSAANSKMLFWCLRSKYLYAVRNLNLNICYTTYLKYVRLLGLAVKRPRRFLKKHKTGLRASRPNEFLQCDITIQHLISGVKVFIYLIIDNFSRKILNWTVADCVSGQIRRDTLIDAFNTHIDPLFLSKKISILSDAGPENDNHFVKDWINQNPHTLPLLLALKNCEYSNNMIEHINHVLKSENLRHSEYETINDVRKKLDECIPVFNSERPQGVLGGLTPDEVYSGIKPFSLDLSKRFADARKLRHYENKNRKCHCNPLSIG